MQKAASLILKDKVTVGLFGLGESNAGVYEYIRRKNGSARFVIREENENFDSVLAFSELRRGSSALTSITEDLIFLSPSVKRQRLEGALKKSTVISSDHELFFEEFSGLRFAVTGSSGKSTTTYLISELLSKSGIPSCAAGNFGKALSPLIDSGLTPVAELSSFQLTHYAPKTDRAVITNIYPNHLNWHKDLDEYASAKMKLLEKCSEATVDIDSHSLAERLSGRRVFCAVSSVLDL